VKETGMAEVQRTLAIVKPDAVKQGAAGEILRRVEASGLRILALKMTSLSEGLARGFYAVHRERPFYADLVRFMTEGPVVMAVLEGADAIPRYRELMGATNPAKAAPGTIRADFGSSIERNAVHGSDAPETARVEIAYFFNASEIQGPVEALP
jgi:nucleoside-diphosphate kinase